jgi:FkbM family methyltransferase
MKYLRKHVGSIVRSLQRRALLPAPIGDQSHSGAGEDRLVLAWLQIVYLLRDATKIRYCDIGANHPRTLNNTFALYQRGASGVLVEPDPDLCAALRKERPRDTVIEAGVAFDERRSAKLQRLTANVFNTFSPTQANFVRESSKNWQPDQLQKIIDEIEVPLVPVNDILAEHFAAGLHFISIDAEGVDFSILQSIDFTRFRPKIVCVEVSRSLAEFDALLNPFGYELLARTPDNVIYGQSAVS